MKTNDIIVRNLSKNYGGKVILDNISFNVVSGEITVLSGLNGAGKTSIIKIILGLINYDFGSVEIFGIDNKFFYCRNDVVFLPEKFFPSSFITGHEFAKLFTSYHNIKLNISFLEQLCQNFEFDTDLLDKKIGCYSKGTVQKIGLIMTFLVNPKLIIIDEAMSGLDFKAREIVKNNMIDFKKRGGTIFFTTHLLSDLNDFCDNIIIIDQTTICTNSQLLHGH